MDVIALAAAGFEEAVAPLGTAITAEQLARLPGACARAGDRARRRRGRAACGECADRPGAAPARAGALAGLLPDARRAGPRRPDPRWRAARDAAALERALPLVEMLWRRELGAGALDTPERRAALDSGCARSGQIADGNGPRALRGRTARAARGAVPPSAAGPPPRRRRGPRARGTGRRPGRCPTRVPPGSRATPRPRPPCAGARRDPAGRLPILAAAIASRPSWRTCRLPRRDLEALHAALLGALAEGADPWRPAHGAAMGDLIDTLAAVCRRRRWPRGGARDARRPRRALLAEMIARHRAHLGARRSLRRLRREIATAEGEDWTHRVRAAGDMPRSLDLARSSTRRKRRSSGDAPSIGSRVQPRLVPIGKKKAAPPLRISDSRPRSREARLRIRPRWTDCLPGPRRARAGRARSKR